MTTRPHLKLGRHLLPGLVAVALFAVLAVTFLTESFPAPAGFPGGGSITASIGYALFNFDAGAYPAEGFLATFIIIALVLDVALDASVMLAKTEADGRIAGTLRFRTDPDEPGDADERDPQRSPVRPDGGED